MPCILSTITEGKESGTGKRFMDGGVEMKKRWIIAVFMAFAAIGHATPGVAESGEAGLRGMERCVSTRCNSEIGYFVDALINAGWRWVEIDLQLGVSRFIPDEVFWF